MVIQIIRELPLNIVPHGSSILLSIPFLILPMDSTTHLPIRCQLIVTFLQVHSQLLNFPSIEGPKRIPPVPDLFQIAVEYHGVCFLTILFHWIVKRSRFTNDRSHIHHIACTSMTLVQRTLLQPSETMVPFTSHKRLLHRAIDTRRSPNETLVQFGCNDTVNTTRVLRRLDGLVGEWNIWKFSRPPRKASLSLGHGIVNLFGVGMPFQNPQLAQHIPKLCSARGGHTRHVQVGIGYSVDILGVLLFIRRRVWIVLDEVFVIGIHGSFEVS